jgi:hypothetical protein
VRGENDPAEIAATLQELAGTREALLARSAREIAERLGRVGDRFRNPDDPLTREVLRDVEEEAGLSASMTRRVVAGMARDWTGERLEEVLRREFGDPRRLDAFTPDPRGGRWVRILGDAVALHLGSGSVPGVSATSLIRSLLVKTPVLIKPGAGDQALTRAFHRALAREDPALGASAAVVYWHGEAEELLGVALPLVGRVVAYGSDATVQRVRDATPPTTPTVLYHHRLSVAVLGPEALGDGALESTVAEVARAACTFDQRGCVSPHRVFLLGVGAEGGRVVGEALAHAMAAEARDAPPGAPDPRESARLQQLRGEMELRAAAGEAVALWRSPDTAWTVVLETDGPEGPVGHRRTVFLVPLATPEELARRLGPLGPHLQSVGIAGLGDGTGAVVEALARAGVTRVTALSDMPFPPAWWHHDGQGPLRALVRYVEWEG